MYPFKKKAILLKCTVVANSVFQICHEHDSILDACYVLENKQYCNAESIFSVFQGESQLFGL